MYASGNPTIKTLYKVLADLHVLHLILLPLISLHLVLLQFRASLHMSIIITLREGERERETIKCWSIQWLIYILTNKILQEYIKKKWTYTMQHAVKGQKFTFTMYYREFAPQ